MLEDIRNLSLKNKKVFLRVDFNVPVKNNQILDDTRIKSSIPTINHLVQQGAIIILCSHLASFDSNGSLASLEPVAKHLSYLINQKVIFCKQCVGPKVEQILSQMDCGEILMLENVRFMSEEEENQPSFAKSLASIAQIYINDAFPVSHRIHASVVGITRYLPSYPGLTLLDEIKNLEKYVRTTKPPILAIVGGAKIKQKLGLLRNLIKRTDILCIGGKMSNNFLYVNGYNVHESALELDLIDTTRDILSEAIEHSCRIILPKDVVLENGHTVNISKINSNDRIMDIGKQSIDHILSISENMQTIWWNGPLGKFEDPPFDNGTKQLALGLKELVKTHKHTVVVGGGDTIHALQKFGIDFQDLTYVSTAGGACLEYLEHFTLPGIDALKPSFTKTAY